MIVLFQKLQTCILYPPFIFKGLLQQVSLTLYLKLGLRTFLPTKIWRMLNYMD